MKNVHPKSNTANRQGIEREKGKKTNKIQKEKKMIEKKMGFSYWERRRQKDNGKN